MKIAFCSDSHDNVPNIDKFLLYCKKNKVNLIIHCGDWAAPNILKHFRENFNGEIYGVLGNVHGETEEMLTTAERNRINLSEDVTELEIDGIKFQVVHYPDKAEKLCQKGQADLVLYGHDHKPWLKKKESCYMTNPGTLGGLFNRASFGMYDTQTKKIDLIILDTLKYDA